MAIRKIVSRSISDGAVALADVADGSINSDKIAANAVGSSEIDLTASYTYTGSFSTPNNFKLLVTRSDSSAVNYCRFCI